MTASGLARRSSLVCLLIAALQPPGPARGQLHSRSRAGQAVIERSAPIDNLTKRADEAIKRRDWKFAIDSLQRIIDDPKGALLERTPHLYEPARRWAERTLAGMPAEGLTAYRVLNDGRARRLLEQGIREHDVTALGQAVERYLLTSHGDDAASLLASWLLDEGRPAEALTLLNRVVELCSDHDLPAGSVVARQALAWAMLGAPDAARGLLNDAARPVSPEVGEPLNRLIDQLAREALDDGSRRSSGHGSWRNLGGGGDRRNLMAGVAPTMIAKLPWRHLLPDAPEAVHKDYAWRTGPPDVGAFRPEGVCVLAHDPPQRCLYLERQLEDEHE